MMFTVEPMINLGRPHVKLLSDGWTAVTRDRSLSAQFEHTVGVTETGVEVFTRSPKGLDRPPYGRRARRRHSVSWRAKRAADEDPSPAEGAPHYHGHRDRLRARFREEGAGRARRLRAARDGCCFAPFRGAT